MLRLCASEALFLRARRALVFLFLRLTQVGTLLKRKAICNKRKSKASDAHKRNICMLIRVN